MSRTPLVVEVTRGSVVESTHQVMAVVADSAGHVVHVFGNALYLTPPRSAVKALQALPLLESGAYQRYGLTYEMLALACGSHRGSSAHISVARAWMEKVGLQESQLLCKGHWPYDEKNLHEMVRKNEPFTPLYNNCIGKHLGILTTSSHLKESLSGYDKYEHPAQLRLRRVLGETMRLDNSKMPYGGDGCGIPTYAVPLQNIAIGMSALIDPKEAPIRKMAAEAILQAWRENPLMIAGSDDFASQIAEKTKGRAMVKSGAEGVFTGLMPEQGLAFVVKVADGAPRAAKFVVASLLLQYKGVTRDEALALPQHFQPQVTDWSGAPVGTFRFKKD